MSAAAHAAIFVAVATAWKNPPQSYETQPIAVALIQPPPPTLLPPPPPPPKPSTPRAASHAEAPGPPAAHAMRIHYAPAPPAAPAVQLASAKAPSSGDELSEAQIAGAATGGSGGTGGTGRGCDMAGRVQVALRRDALVKSAVAPLQGKAVMVWNGDWVQHEGEDGRGLAAVREAIMWEVAFAPAACRTEPVHGLVLLSLNSGSTRLAVGSSEWRWSDLLNARSYR
ncbi:MAG TPA: hypothetical protein VMT68_14540 [Caulobacteraceae bacterium]|nr:hypothetical protein [Caulobacteraceae bacterium]